MKLFQRRAQAAADTQRIITLLYSISGKEDSIMASLDDLQVTANNAVAALDEIKALLDALPTGGLTPEQQEKIDAINQVLADAVQRDDPTPPTP